MGLDMYLSGRKYVRFSDKGDALGELIQSLHGIKHKISSVNVELGYWRKFNALHAAFQKETKLGDGAEEIYITKEFFEGILHDLKEVAAGHDKAAEVLPCEGGFFFGSTEYNDDYFYQVDLAIKEFEKLLSDNIFDTYDVYYSASW